MFCVSFAFGMATLSNYALFEYIAGAGALFGTLAELVITQVDDNLSIPLSAGFVMTLIRWRISNYCSFS